MSVLMPPPPPAHPFIPRLPVLPLSVEQYHAMIEAGILTEDHPVELLAGWLAIKMSKNPPHRVATRLLTSALEALVPAGWYVDSQEPITLPDSEPEPDAMIVRGRTRDYLDRHPGPADLALVVEVAETTLDRDRGLKLEIYASAGVSVYWILNLVDHQLEVYTSPVGTSYAQRQDYGSADEVPVMIEGREVGRIAISELLP